jgi:hypothetical protein
MKTRYNIELELQVLELYKSNLETIEICQQLNVYKDYPSIVAKKYGVARGSGKKSTISPELFIYGSKNADYWIGYIIADGNIFCVNRSSRVSLASVDLEIKDKFISYCKANYHLQGSNLHVMYFSSKKIVENLLSYGISPKKSLTIELTVPINNHLLRGIFDGDGCVHNRRSCCKITTGSINLGKQIVDYLERFNIYSKLRLRKNTNHYDVWVEREEDFKKFFNLIYLDSEDSIRLDRKYQKFLSLINKLYQN